MPAIHSVSSAPDARVTVIFVHGSHGHYIKDWGTTDSEENWLFWIGHELDHADVFSIQHEANFWSLSDISTIDEYAETVGHLVAESVRTTKVVFVAYSIGGVIVKRLMKLVANGDNKLKGFSPAECSFCFIATPHLGANFTVFQPIVKILPNGVLSTIFGWNPEIERIYEDFLKIQKPLVDGIVCFSERKRFGGLFTIVPKRSSFIEDPRALNFAISRNHSEICVVGTRSDLIYKCVLKLARNEKPKKTHVGESSFELDQAIVDRMFKSG